MPRPGSPVSRRGREEAGRLRDLASCIGMDRVSFHSSGAPALRPGAIAQSPGREAALPGRASPSPSHLLAFAHGKEQVAVVQSTFPLQGEQVRSLVGELGSHNAVPTPPPDVNGKNKLC